MREYEVVDGTGTFVSGRFFLVPKEIVNMLALEDCVQTMAIATEQITQVFK